MEALTRGLPQAYLHLSPLGNLGHHGIGGVFRDTGLVIEACCRIFW